MTDEDVNKLRTVVKEEVTSVVKEELKPINERLGRVEQKDDVKTTVHKSEGKADQMDRKLDRIVDTNIRHK